MLGVLWIETKQFLDFLVLVTSILKHSGEKPWKKNLLGYVITIYFYHNSCLIYGEKKIDTLRVFVAL